ncbi:hypothetical protein GVN24_24680 [Rhizobium sp. CRIBSB]|nr:hypothetical protein [Rhizobium sp. CRIBSB]
MIRALTLTSLTGLLATGTLLAVINAKNVEERTLRGRIAEQTVCLEALSGGDIEASREPCPAGAAQRHRVAVRAARCDAALLSGDLYAVEASCSGEVKTLQAGLSAETRRADALTGLLATARATQAEAVSRAEARARTQTERTHRAQTAVRTAPLDDSGLVVCDAGCLRLRAGD